jgi:hypothetical protein
MTGKEMRIPFLLIASLALIIVGMIVFVVLVVIVPDAFATIATLNDDSMAPTLTPTPAPTPVPAPTTTNNPSIILSEPLDLTEDVPLNEEMIIDQFDTPTV